MPTRFPSLSSNAGGIKSVWEKQENASQVKKKIAKPLFYRYIASAFLSNTIYQRAGVRVVE